MKLVTKVKLLPNAGGKARLLVAYTGADWQHDLLLHQQGESDLLYQDGKFCLAPTATGTSTPAAT